MHAVSREVSHSPAAQVVQPFQAERELPTNDFSHAFFRKSQEVLRALPSMEDLETLPDEELKGVAKALETECFLCEKILKKEGQLADEEHWHLLHCVGTMMTLLFETRGSI